MRCRISEHNAWTAKETLGDLNRVALQYFTVSKGLCLISIEALGQYGWGRAFTSIIRQTQFHRLKGLKPSAYNLGPNTYAERLQICTYTQLTFPMLCCVTSKDVIPTSDNHHSGSFAIAERMKGRGCLAIARGAIYQRVVAGACHRVF